MLIFTLPVIIHSIREAIQSGNYIQPAMELGEKILLSDSVLYRQITEFSTNPDLILGMAKPDTGIFNNIVYFIHIILFTYDILGLIYFIFLPMFIMYKLFSLSNTSNVGRNFLIALVLFLVYLFITNSIITVYGMATKSVVIELPEGIDKLTGYFIIFKQVMPFHGIYALGEYLFRLIFL